jgi:signal peptidase I
MSIQTEALPNDAPPVIMPEANIKPKWREQVETLLVALVLALGMRTFIAEPRYIPTGSMIPTLNINERLIVEKITYRLSVPKRGDIVVFKPPTRAEAREGEDWIKRVIAVEGEKISVHNGAVWINDKALKESYIAETPAYPEPFWDELGLKNNTVPSGAVLVFGDNRNDSRDSHYWGALPISNIIGKALVRFWPLERFGLLNQYQTQFED